VPEATTVISPFASTDSPFISTLTMTNYTCRIHHWISTGEHVIKDDFSNNKASRSKVETEKMYNKSSSKTANVPEHPTEISLESSSGHSSTSSQSEHIELLVGCENDILILSSYHISSTILECQSIWRTYIARANSQPPGYMTAGSLNPCNLLQNIPLLS